MNDVRKGPGDLPGDSSNPNSPDYDARFDELVEELFARYSDDPEKVAEADDNWSGTLEGSTYEAIERELANLWNVEPSDLVGSGTLDRLYQLAKVCHANRHTQLAEMAENDATIQLDREDNISHDMRFGSEP